MCVLKSVLLVLIRRSLKCENRNRNVGHARPDKVASSVLCGFCVGVVFDSVVGKKRKISSSIAVGHFPTTLSVTITVCNSTFIFFQSLTKQPHCQTSICLLTLAEIF